ncbi:phage head completion protein [Paraglaciecola sp.]|uniref:phage head completion protein n=1 Tax=Paraglaciecola sp. TaxID=1920173 RepID=UPI003EF6E7F6
MSAGKKRHPVIFEKKVITQNAIGESVENWQHEFNTLCEIKKSKIDTVNEDDANLIISDIKLVVNKTSCTKNIAASQYRATINNKSYLIVETDPYESAREITLYASNYD